MKQGKKYVDSAKLIDSTKAYDSGEALDLVCQTAKAKFDETVELQFIGYFFRKQPIDRNL